MFVTIVRYSENDMRGYILWVCRGKVCVRKEKERGRERERSFENEIWFTHIRTTPSDVAFSICRALISLTFDACVSEQFGVGGELREREGGEREREREREREHLKQREGKKENTYTIP